MEKKTVLITGANRGIGLGLTTELLQRGHRVVATARDPAAAASLHTLDRAHPGQLEILALDVVDSNSTAAAASALAGKVPALDVLVNNAGVFPKQHDCLAHLQATGMLQAFQTNVIGPVLVAQAFLPLLEKGRHPAVINISSRAGCVSQPLDSMFYTYGASKAALNRLTRDIARELKPRGITVVAISPGWVRTDMGGPDGPLSVGESASALADLVENISPADSGQFIDPRNRHHLYPW